MANPLPLLWISPTLLAAGMGMTPAPQHQLGDQDGQLEDTRARGSFNKTLVTFLPLRRLLPSLRPLPPGTIKPEGALVQIRCKELG